MTQLSKLWSEPSTVEVVTSFPQSCITRAVMGLLVEPKKDQAWHHKSTKWWHDEEVKDRDDCRTRGNITSWKPAKLHLGLEMDLFDWSPNSGTSVPIDSQSWVGKKREREDRRIWKGSLSIRYSQWQVQDTESRYPNYSGWVFSVFLFFYVKVYQVSYTEGQHYL